MDWTLAKPDPLHRHRRRAGRPRLSRHAGAGRQRQSAAARDDPDRDAAQSEPMNARSQGRSDEAPRPPRFAPLESTRRFAPSRRSRHFAPSTSWRASLSDRRGLSRTSAASRRPEGPSLTGLDDRKSCFQEVDGALCGRLTRPRAPTPSSWLALSPPSSPSCEAQRWKSSAADRAGRRRGPRTRVDATPGASFEALANARAPQDEARVKPNAERSKNKQPRVAASMAGSSPAMTKGGAT